MTVANSSKLMTPSPSVSACRIISVSSRKVSGWPMRAIDRASSAAEMYPLPSRSNDRKTSRSCSWLTKACSVMTGASATASSSNSTDPLPLASMLASSAWIWSPVGLRPRERSRAASSRCVRLPSRSMSNRSNMSRSCFRCSPCSPRPIDVVTRQAIPTTKPLVASEVVKDRKKEEEEEGEEERWLFWVVCLRLIGHLRWG
ncbi:unnamed protein product, partial [Musa hybrid cultivar]